MYIVDQKISFTYRNRKVKGTVERVDDQYILVKLDTDYIGKNDEWFIGESKLFEIKLIK